MASKEYEDSDDESRGSLDDFIVDEASTEESEVSEEEDSCDDDSDVSSTSSAEENDVPPTEGPAGKKRKVVEDPEVLRLLAEEAEKFAGPIQGTVVGGRTLRSREPEKVKARQPRNSYYEKYGAEEEARVMEKFNKKDIIKYLSVLAKDNKEAYEMAGHVWPKLTMSMAYDKIRAEYESVKAFLGLPDSDDENSDDEEEEDSDEDDDEDDEEEDSEGSED